MSDCFVPSLKEEAAFTLQSVLFTPPRTTPLSQILQLLRPSNVSQRKVKTASTSSLLCFLPIRECLMMAAQALKSEKERLDRSDW